MMKHRLILIALVFLILLTIVIFLPKISSRLSRPPKVNPSAKVAVTINPVTQKVEYSQDFTTVLVGDSMTATLGNSDELRSYLTQYYPDKTFEFLNYGFGSTNILSVEKRLTETTFYERDFQPILNIDFDLILIESFGNNPLSEFSLEEGLKKQTEALDKIVNLIKKSNPRAPIIFVATLAPDARRYGEGKVNLSDEERKRWVADRTAYIKNHISYANSHNIPLINIYQDTLNSGEGTPEYIDNESHIHPSPKGVIFISKKIADFLYEYKILENIKKS